MDRVPRAISEAIDKTNEVIQSSYLLAARIAILEDQGDFLLPYHIYEEVESLNEKLYSSDRLDVTFNGVGCIPAVMPDGELGSIYGRANIYKGVINRFHITSSDYMNYIDLSDIEVLEGSESPLMIDNGQSEWLREQIIEPESRLQLFTEFILDAVEESEVAGSAIRAPIVEHYADVESGSLEIINMDIYEEPELQDADMLPECMIQEAAKTRSMLVDTAYRRMPRLRQARLLEDYLDRVNKRLKVDRFQVIIRPIDIYVPDTSNSNRRMVHLRLPGEVGQFIAKCLYIDSMEHFLLTDWERRITRSGSMRDSSAGFCLVAELSDVTRSALGIPTNIIWIPIRPPIKGGRGRVSYDDPILDAIVIEDTAS